VDIIISNSSNEPIYEQIIRQIKNMIIQGNLGENDSLPSIRNLAKELSISVITTKRAYEELEREGLINKVAGKGTYIAAQSADLLREKRLKMIEEKLTSVVSTAKSLDISLDELQDMLMIIYEEV
jgi:GntR family transcriptional regulator